MSTIMPQDEGLKRAIQWVSAQLEDHPESRFMKWVNEAGARFDLSPASSQFLINFFRDRQEKSES